MLIFLVLVLGLGEDLDTEETIFVFSREELFSSFFELKYLPNVKGLAKELEGALFPNPKKNKK